MPKKTAPRSSASDREPIGHPNAYPELDTAALLADPGVEILVCCGSGGVGKTSLSAALAVRAAESGRCVVVLTIDPAKRLAQALGIIELDNDPRPVTDIDPAAGGSLDAMMLDMKRTFDEVVEAHAQSEKAEQILNNPFYQALSTSFSGTQEYMAMEKLGQLHDQVDADGHRRWDLIIVDTPPARSALDFLDAPEHLSRLLDGRILKLFLSPTKGPMRIMSVGVSLVTSAMNRVLGSQVLRDMQTFITAFETLFGGFRQRAEATLANLSSEHTRFIVVGTPEPDALREASFFIDRLSAENMPLAGVIINRVHRTDLTLSRERAATLSEDLAKSGEPQERLASTALGLAAVRIGQIQRERKMIEKFQAMKPRVRVAEVPAMATPVSDLDSLRWVARQLSPEL